MMKGCLATTGGIVLLISAMLAFMFFCNSLTNSEWNDGVCSKCNVTYELRGISDALKYYVCPSCHNEVSRF